MKKTLIYYFIISLSCFSCKKNLEKKIFQKSTEQHLNNTLLASIPGDPIDFDINENGIIVLSRSAKKDDANDIILKYKLHLYSLMGEEKKRVTIYTEKNKYNILNSNESSEFQKIKIVNELYLVCGFRILKKEFDADHHFKTFNKNLEVVNEKSISHPNWQRIQALKKYKSKIFVLSDFQNEDNNTKNKVFNSHQNISLLNNKLIDFKDNSLYFKNLVMPSNFDKTIIAVECYDFAIDSENYYILCRAKRKSELFSPLLISINRNSKQVNWVVSGNNTESNYIYFPNIAITLNKKNIAIASLQDGNTSITIFNKKGEIKTEYKNNKFHLPHIIHLEKDNYVLSGSRSIDKDLPAKYQNLTKKSLGNQAFINYSIEIDGKGNYLQEDYWGDEDSESVLKSKYFNGKTYFLSSAFVPWPRKKYTKIYTK